MAVVTATASSPPDRISPSRPVTTVGVGLLVITDAAAMTAAIARFGELTANTGILVALAVWALALGDHYRLRLDLSVLDEMVGIAGRVVAAISLGAAYRELVSGHDVFTVDRLWVLVGAVVFVVAGRSMAYAVVRGLRQRGYLRRRTVLVAPTETAAAIEDAIAADPGCGLVPVGTPLDLTFPTSVIEDRAADVAIVALTEATRHDATDLVRRLAASGTEVYLLPMSLMHYPGAVPGADQVASLPLLPVRLAANHSLRWKLKRIIDVILVVAVLPIAAPIVGAAALGLRLEGGPDVLYRQERVGLGGRRFTMYKLRTIPAGRVGVDQTWSVDPATIAPVARFCRATSIDELPQLWNVLVGDMSLVGPRPALAEEVQAFDDELRERSKVRPGITGLWQVEARSNAAFNAYRRLDLHYVENWTLALDLRILLATVEQVIVTLALLPLRMFRRGPATDGIDKGMEEPTVERRQSVGVGSAEDVVIDLRDRTRARLAAAEPAAQDREPAEPIVGNEEQDAR